MSNSSKILILLDIRTALKRHLVMSRLEEKRKDFVVIITCNSFGTNTQRLRKIKTLWELVLENFEDHILRILLLAATCSLVIGVVQHGWKAGWVEGAAIFMAVAVIVTVTAGNNWIKEKQF
jgi:magnesium-transporting ATPase (P-type)